MMMRPSSPIQKFLLSTILFFILNIFFITPLQAAELQEKLKSITLPAGFHIAVYAQDLKGARSLAIGKRGTVFIGTRDEGNVYAIVDTDGDYQADKRFIIARGLNSPNGVAFRDGSLYVAEINRVLRYDDIEDRLVNPPQPVVVNDSFPENSHHGWKFIRFGPDGYLYVPVGAPCNICESADLRYASIMRMRPDGTGLEIFAHGVRNTVGFDWAPKTNIMFFTDNGRDWMGNNKPPDELNMAPQPGMNFGYPYCHGSDITDPEFGKEKKCSELISPVMELGPHVAALGMRFYTGNQFPEEYRNQIFIAEHGSWNRFPSIGYRITLVRFTNGRPSSNSVFAQGWKGEITSWGRPVDVEVTQDGALLVSDDKAGAVYRIWYGGAN
jgi:glucose/arabinose dehydrogenase